MHTGRGGLVDAHLQPVVGGEDHVLGAGAARPQQRHHALREVQAVGHGQKHQRQACSSKKKQLQQERCKSGTVPSVRHQ